MDKPNFGLINNLSELVHDIDIAEIDRLPDLRKGSTILVGSDYSGRQRSSEYEVLVFLLADIEGSRRWMIERSWLRYNLPPDGRRFSFKSLGDRTLMKALPCFLEASSYINGLLVGILTHKSIDSLFKKTGRITRSDPEIRGYPDWKPKVIEKLLRIVNFISLFIAGLSRPMQDVLWITDEDDIAPNEDRHYELVDIFGKICSHYLAHSLRHLRIATTASDTGKRDVEDFVSVADIAAGAISEVVSRYKREGLMPSPSVIVPVLPGFNQKTIEIMNWLSNHKMPLKKLFFSIDPIPQTTSLRVRLWNFVVG